MYSTPCVILETETPPSCASWLLLPSLFALDDSFVDGGRPAGGSCWFIVVVSQTRRRISPSSASTRIDVKSQLLLLLLLLDRLPLTGIVGSIFL